MKYQFLINKRESTCLKHFNVSKAFIEYSNDMNDVYKNIEEYNRNMECKVLIVFHDLIYETLRIQFYYENSKKTRTSTNLH